MNIVYISPKGSCASKPSLVLISELVEQMGPVENMPGNSELTLVIEFTGAVKIEQFDFIEHTVSEQHGRYNTLKNDHCCKGVVDQ